MTSLGSRAQLRTRVAAESLARKILTRVSTDPPEPACEEPQAPQPAPEPVSVQATPPIAESFIREVAPGHFADPTQNRASTKLYERLSHDDLEEIQRSIDEVPDLQQQYVDAYNEAARQHMILAFGVWLEVACASEETGLVKVQPPEEIHVMTRGPLAAAGGLYEADMVIDALVSAGIEMADVESALDFGCSSGRVLSVLRAAYPQTTWHGCDPNAPAIEWASENLPGIEFFVSGNAPPLPLADGSLDMVYAISIWSHFAPELGLSWFEEMHRLIRSGGHLVCTTHGLTSVAYSAAHGRSEEQVEEILDSLYRQGSWYAPEFGEEGDWGVVNPDWGTAFLSPEWMLTHLCPRWRVLEFAPGRNQENQDVYVLQRV
jgi:SAM-dependent methyltransferase